MREECWKLSLIHVSPERDDGVVRAEIGGGRSDEKFENKNADESFLGSGGFKREPTPINWTIFKTGV
jgi:hypothetical protein